MLFRSINEKDKPLYKLNLSIIEKWMNDVLKDTIDIIMPNSQRLNEERLPLEIHGIDRIKLSVNYYIK